MKRPYKLKATTLKGLLLIFICLGWPAEARKFSFKTEDMAAYFRGTGGLSAVDQDAFSKSSGNGTTLSSEKPNINYGAELGFLFKIHEAINFRLGAEILQAKVSQVKGTNSS
ncbi:MAG: hypothetical protein KDD34_02665, partial [Bdellovibrionales bacterium]|nr:hypothetical protein [Bdellovibrionales bacterium]